jgi:hypothetical protein
MISFCFNVTSVICWFNICHVSKELYIDLTCMLYAITVEAGCVCSQVNRTGVTQRFHHYISHGLQMKIKCGIKWKRNVMKMYILYSRKIWRVCSKPKWVDQLMEMYDQVQTLLPVRYASSLCILFLSMHLMWFPILMVCLHTCSEQSYFYFYLVLVFLLWTYIHN